MCQGGVRVSPGVIKLMNPGPYWPLYLWRGPARREGRVQRTAPCHTIGGVSSHPMVARLVRYGPVRQKKTNFS
jgi:hypothetical protein